MNPHRRSFGCILLAFVGSAFLIALALFITQVVFDGMDANLMRFEGEPAQGMEYWRNAELRKAMPNLVVLWSLTACLVVLVLWLASKKRK